LPVDSILFNHEHSLLTHASALAPCQGVCPPYPRPTAARTAFICQSLRHRSIAVGILGLILFEVAYLSKEEGFVRGLHPDRL
jgi:hypothetical protein